MRQHLHSNMVRFIIFDIEPTQDVKVDYLHSNMVRFIICKYKNGFGFDRTIYIPIWLDLLLLIMIYVRAEITNLHSNMVRFIIFFN